MKERNQDIEAIRAHWRNSQPEKIKQMLDVWDKWQFADIQDPEEIVQMFGSILFADFPMKTIKIKLD